MELILERKFKKEDYTIGRLYIDGVYFCDTLEDRVRIINGNCSDKIYGQTAIPEGTYDVKLIHRTSNGVLTPWLQNVPCFTGILIHSGNDELDTEGCILVGQNKIKGKVINSISTFNNLMIILEEEENIIITIK
jgi:hypothetical protein